MQLFNIATVLASSAALSHAAYVAIPPSGKCAVSLAGTPYTQLTLRPTPCNDQQPIATMKDGQFVTNFQKSKAGCGFMYSYVGYNTPDGKYLEGWVGSQYIYCPSSPPTPAANSSCSNWAVRYGGGSSACGEGKSFTASSNDTCSTDGSDCASKCCATPIVYRRGNGV